MKLCCFFNYPPLYREDIYRKIDETFDTRFYFGRAVMENGKNSNIAKLDLTMFRNRPVEFDNKEFFGKFMWRRKNIRAAFADADTFLVTGDFCYSYLPFLIICRLLGKRVYGWGHGPKMGRGKTWIFYYWILKLMTGYFAYGENNRKRMIEIGFDPDRIYPIYNSLGEGVPEKIRKGLKSDVLTAHFGNEDPTILFIGRLTPQKDLGKLVEMAGRHRKEGLNYNLLFIGDGPEKAKLVGMAEKLGVSQYVWFYGACYDDDVMGSLIYNCDLCVAPGNVGLTALHAMTYGVPVGSHSDFETQMPEYETIVDSETGFLFRKDDWNDLADKIQKWLAAKSSPEKREETRQACFRMIDSKWNSLNQIEILKKVLAGG